MNAQQAAAVISASVLASLKIALEQGVLTSDSLAAIARAAGNNAAMQLEVSDEE
jgi:hypothetical protein